MRRVYKEALLGLSSLQFTSTYLVDRCMTRPSCYLLGLLKLPKTDWNIWKKRGGLGKAVVERTLSALYRVLEQSLAIIDETTEEFNIPLWEVRTEKGLGGCGYPHKLLLHIWGLLCLFQLSSSLGILQLSTYSNSCTLHEHCQFHTLNQQLAFIILFFHCMVL